MKITLIIHGLSSGGAERVMSVLANYWAAKGWQINILTFVDEAPFYRLDSKINYIPLGIAKNSTNLATAIINNWQSIQKLRRAITKSDPNLVISFMTNVNVTTLLATRGLNIPVVISERNDPNKLPASKVWISLRSLTYGLASAIVVQTNRAFNYFRPQLQSKMAIIANPVIIQTEPSSYNPESSNQLSIVAMGRLEHQKGFDLLLEAFAHLKDDYPEWTLSILGEGTLREELESQRSRLKLGDRVYFPGRVENPAQLLKQADIFVMSSRFEGFPNALCEAMACGLPVISTDCPNGPREIIRDQVDGILVANESITELKEAIENLIINQHTRQNLGKKALEITDRFGLETVIDRWEKVISELVTK